MRNYQTFKGREEPTQPTDKLGRKTHASPTRRERRPVLRAAKLKRDMMNLYAIAGVVVYKLTGGRVM